MENSKITFNEIDFILPSYRYNIRFSFTTKQGLSFIREFVLRLVQLGPMLPNQIANYIGLNEIEAKEALSDLILREELQYNKHNQIELTEKSSGYFESLGSSLSVSELRSSGANLGFELTSLTCVSTQQKRLPREWRFGYKLEVESQKISNRDKLISKAFQRHFQDLIDDGYMDHLKDSNGGKPNIYKVESLNQIGQEPVRLKLKFQIDADGSPIECDDFSALKDSTEAHELIANSIHQLRRGDNSREILNAIELLGDKYSNRFFSKMGFQLAEFITSKSGEDSNRGYHVPFVGSLYSEENWKTFTIFFDKEKDKLTSQHQDGIIDFKWLVPADPSWGKSDRIMSCFNEIVLGSKSTGKTPKSLYNPRFILPLNNAGDSSEKKKWAYEFSEFIDSLYGYVEGYHGGSVEVTLLGSRLVTVTYYLNLPELYRVAFPIGFISTDSRLINQVNNSLNNYLSEYHSDEGSKDLGMFVKK